MKSLTVIDCAADAMERNGFSGVNHKMSAIQMVRKKDNCQWGWVNASQESSGRGKKIWIEDQGRENKLIAIFIWMEDLNAWFHSCQAHMQSFKVSLDVALQKRPSHIVLEQHKVFGQHLSLVHQSVLPLPFTPISVASQNVFTHSIKAKLVKLY